MTRRSAQAGITAGIPATAEWFKGDRGLDFTSVDWLVDHHRADEPERRRMAADLRFQPGEVVLDAGCGPGLWTSLFAAQVAPGGRVIGADHSPQLLDYAASHAAGHTLEGRVEFVAGDLRALPFPNSTFDAVFIGNCLAYASGHLELLAELRRVTRSGGRVCVKDFDGAVLLCHPLDPALTARVLAATATRLAADRPDMELDNFVGRKLPSLLRQAGLAEVTVASYAVQKTAPLTPQELRYLKATADWYVEAASPHLTAEDLHQWRAAFDPNDDRCILSHPDFYVCMLEIVATGLA